MTRRERLMATLQGRPVDRPPVCFYELDSVLQRPDNPDPFNIYSHPSWLPLLELTREHSDCIARRSIYAIHVAPDPCEELTTNEAWLDAAGTQFSRTVLRAGSRNLVRLSRRDPDIDTVWTLEHPCKDTDDLRAWLDLPETAAPARLEPAYLLDAEAELGERGIAMLDAPDPLGLVAPLFDMATFTIIAYSEPELMHRALQKAARGLLPKVEAVAAALPGRLWRIAGPEYASPPYLPPHLFAEYVTRYVTPLVRAIQRHGGYARVHSHGRLRDILPHIAATGCDGLDPIEPPPQGDVELHEVRRAYGDRWVLFGNLEIADIENLPTPEFVKKVQRALTEGTSGSGRGFVLMPSASPYGRHLAPLTLRNYQALIAAAT